MNSPGSNPLKQGLRCLGALLFGLGGYTLFEAIHAIYVGHVYSGRGLWTDYNENPVYFSFVVVFLLALIAILFYGLYWCFHAYKQENRDT